jgi:hypothetical protein
MMSVIEALVKEICEANTIENKMVARSGYGKNRAGRKQAEAIQFKSIDNMIHLSLLL